jgi:hypothetical protein
MSARGRPGECLSVCRARRPAANFLQRPLENEPAVTAVLEKNPSRDKPPIYLCAVLRNAYADHEEKAKGLWWNRQG